MTRTNSLETIRNMVASGLGVSVLPRDALTPKYHSRLVVPVPFSRAGPFAARRARASQELSAAGAIAAIRDAVAACRGASGGERAPRTVRDARAVATGIAARPPDQRWSN